MYVSRATTTHHMVSFINFYSHFLAKFQTLTSPHMSSIFTNVLSRDTHVEPGGAIHSTKISGNFGLKLNGSVRSNRKSFGKSGLPFKVDLFSRLDRSDRIGPFHLTISTHFNPRTSLFGVQNGGKYSSLLAVLWIVNSRSIGVTRTSM